MMLLTKVLKEKLIANDLKQSEVRGTPDEIDFDPVVKLFTPDGGASWLLTELDAEDGDIAFGLCDLGVGCPELGYVSLSELSSVRGVFGMPIERDRNFRATKSLLKYAEEARQNERIVA